MTASGPLRKYAIPQSSLSLLKRQSPREGLHQSNLKASFVAVSLTCHRDSPGVSPTRRLLQFSTPESLSVEIV